jgi:hypothetical protein
LGFRDLAIEEAIAVGAAGFGAKLGLAHGPIVNQSAFIAGALLAGFVIFLAARNRLGAYLAVLWGNTTAPTPGPGTSGTITGSGGGTPTLGGLVPNL